MGHYSMVKFPISHIIAIVCIWVALEHSKLLLLTAVFLRYVRGRIGVGKRRGTIIPGLLSPALTVSVFSLNYQTSCHPCMGKKYKHCITILSFLFFSTFHATSESILLPFGTNVGNQSVFGDDSSSEPQSKLAFANVVCPFSGMEESVHL